MFIEHYSCIAITKGAVVGDNITLFQGTTIGKNFGGKNYGYPTIGNNVILFAGAKIIGNIKVGNNVIVGANCVVNSNIPDNCVVAGIPGKVISTNFRDAITRAEYELKFGLRGY